MARILIQSRGVSAILGHFARLLTRRIGGDNIFDKTDFITNVLKVRPKSVFHIER
jgi:hypothetical protein